MFDILFYADKLGEEGGLARESHGGGQSRAERDEGVMVRLSWVWYCAAAMVLAGAGRAAYGQVYGNTTIRGMQTPSANRGSDSLASFRAYSTGVQNLNVPYGRRATDPLWYNSRAALAAPVPSLRPSREWAPTGWLSPNQIRSVRPTAALARADVRMRLDQASGQVRPLATAGLGAPASGPTAARRAGGQVPDWLGASGMFPAVPAVQWYQPEQTPVRLQTLTERQDFGQRRGLAERGTLTGRLGLESGKELTELPSVYAAEQRSGGGLNRGTGLGQGLWGGGLVGGR